MDKGFKILIVDDEVLIAQDLKEILEEVGYDNIFKAKNYNQAIEILNSTHLDLVLLDINLNDTKSGIDVANFITQNFQTPFIFITSYSDSATISSVKHTHPSGFLLKPYSKNQLLASIEIALFNYSSKTNAAEKPIESKVSDINDNDLFINNHILIKDNYRFVKISFNEILWFESDKNYIEVKTLQKKYIIRSSLKKLSEQLPSNNFIKCYKQFIINVHKVESFGTSTVKINGYEIPISRNTQGDVLKMLKQAN